MHRLLADTPMAAAGHPRPTGGTTWSGLGDINAQFAIPGPIRSVTAARGSTDGGDEGTQFLYC